MNNETQKKKKINKKEAENLEEKCPLVSLWGQNLDQPSISI